AAPRRRSARWSTPSSTRSPSWAWSTSRCRPPPSASGGPSRTRAGRAEPAGAEGGPSRKKWLRSPSRVGRRLAHLRQVGLAALLEEAAYGAVEVLHAEGQELRDEHVGTATSGDARR